MMHLAYLAFVRPIELLLGALFGTFYRWSGAYGISLILLSAAVTLLTAPLYYLAERWKREEEEISFRMRRDLASVKRNYSGQKRFYLTRNVHRLYGYKPALQLKASFGLLVQIPFFFGAYSLLSGYEGLRGQGFLFLADLGKPDGLLRGANLLPFAMTAINLASAAAYTRSLSYRKNSTMLWMALLFLVLLYDRPSALLLYWSMNNLLSLGKNLFFPAKRAAEPEGLEEEPGALASLAAWLKGLYGGSLREPALILAAAVILSLQGGWLIEKPSSFKYCLGASAASAAALSVAVFALRLRRGEGLSHGAIPPLAAWLLAAASAYLLFFERHGSVFVSTKNVKMLSTIFIDAAALAAARYGLAGTGPNLSETGSLASSRRDSVRFFAAVAGLSLYFFVLSPLTMYYSSPKDVGMGPAALARAELVPFLGLIALAAAAIFVRAKRARRPPLGLVLSMGLAALAFSVLSANRYGILDEFALEKDFLLDRASPLSCALDIAIIAAAAVCGRYLARRRPREAMTGIAILVAAGAIQVGAAAARSDPSEALAAGGGGTTDVPALALEAHRFSKEGRNLVFIIADMFNGNYLGRAAEERPELEARLDGFTWYPNTLAASFQTATSLPAMLGGPQYAPDRIDDLPGTGRDKLQRAAGLFFGGMAGDGFAISLTDPFYIDCDTLLPRGETPIVTHSEQYVGRWRSERGRERLPGMESHPKATLLAMVSLFRAAPFMLKPRVYDGGSWVLLRESMQLDSIALNTEVNYSYLDLLPELSSAVRGSQDRCIFIHTQLTHEPFGIDSAGRIIEGEYPDPSTKSAIRGKGAYYSAEAFLDLLLRWTDWMKGAGIYDNTAIIVVSDHGNSAYDCGRRFPAALDDLNDREALSRVSALLLVKPFGARGRLGRDERPLSGSDTAAIAFGELGDGRFGPSPVKGAAHAKRNLTFGKVDGTWEDFLGAGRSSFTIYRVAGDMNYPAAWSKERLY